MPETWVWSLGQQDPLEKGMATHSSTLAWRILWTENRGRPRSMGFQRVEHDWATSTAAPKLAQVEFWDRRRGRRAHAQLLSRVRLCSPRSLAGSSAQGIFPARILESVAISSSRGCVQFIIKACIYISNNFPSVVVTVFFPYLILIIFSHYIIIFKSD